MKQIIVITGASGGFGALTRACSGSSRTHRLRHHAWHHRRNAAQVQEA
jgi:NADP-dependent 3-hydroxy acid dehydrogenase YdfG